MVHESTAQLVSEISGSWRTSVIGVVKARTKIMLGNVFLLLFPSCRERMVMLALLFSFFFFHLTYSRWTSLPSCLWSQRIFPSPPGSRFTIFLSRCKFSTLTTRQPMVEFYLLTFPRFPLRKKEHKSYFGKNRTHDFRTSRCAAYLLDHSGDEYYLTPNVFYAGSLHFGPHISDDYFTIAPPETAIRLRSSL